MSTASWPTRTASEDEVDVVVIGAGPAGATAALTLAGAGRSVLLLEREVLPRFHIGESQLPYTAEVLRHMGLYDEARAQGYPIKTGAEFIFPDGDHRRTDFADQGPGRQATTFQVERAHFDHFLARRAERRGARLLQGAAVRELRVDGDGRVTGVVYERDGDPHGVNAPWVLDAGGRSSRVAQQFRTRRAISWLRNVAVFRHYHDVDERHNPGVTGDIQIGGHEDGWLWAIPIWSHTISLGAVMPRSALRAGANPEAVLDAHLERVPRIRARLRGARPGASVRLESDFCYYSDRLTGRGWMLAGDAGCFIDPIFSGGTFLAMVSGRHAGLTLDAVLHAPQRAEEQLAAYERLCKTGYDTYTRLISAYYDSGYRLGGYLAARGFSVDRDQWFARMLSGDFWSGLNPFTEWLRQQRRWDTFAPFPLVRHCPVYPELDAAERGAAA